jgi:hypothetical protein
LYFRAKFGVAESRVIPQLSSNFLPFWGIYLIPLLDEIQGSENSSKNVLFDKKESVKIQLLTYAKSHISKNKL